MTSKRFEPAKGAILGAAFLMATSAIGPGFLTQTATFTEMFFASFGFAILISLLLDIGAQLNIWRILTVTGMRAQDLSNKLVPGLGYVLAALIVLGGLAFNIGNIAGCGLGLNALTGLDTAYGAVISCAVSLVIFWIHDAGKALDLFVKVLGMLMIMLTVYIAISSHPPFAQALYRSVVPDKTFNAEHDVTLAQAIITLVGGTVGGYISFAGAHRLLDAGIKGMASLPRTNRSAVSGIIITGIMRTILFLAALGVVTKGVSLDKTNPASTVFLTAAGDIGNRFFGFVMWSAAITSVVGASFTSVSFIKTFHPLIEKNQRMIISVFIVLSTAIFVITGRPKELLLAAGLVNGFILPVALAIILTALTKKRLVGDFRNPLWLTVTGWLVVLILLAMAVITIVS